MCIEVYATYVCGHTIPIWIPCSYYGLLNCPNYQRQYRSRPLRCSATCLPPTSSSSSNIDEDIIQGLIANSRVVGGDGTFAPETLPTSSNRSAPISGSSSTQALLQSSSSRAPAEQDERAPRSCTGQLSSRERERNLAPESSRALTYSGSDRRPSRSWTEASSSSSRSAYSPWERDCTPKSSETREES